MLEIENYSMVFSFTSLIKMVYSFSSKSGQDPTKYEIEHSVKRNFGGLLGEDDPMRVFEQQLQATAYAEVYSFILFRIENNSMGFDEIW